MIKNTLKLVTGLFCLMAVAASLQAAQVGQKAPDFSVATVSGEEVSLAANKGKIVVLEWTNYDCPFVKKFYESGKMQELQKQYTDAGVVWYTVCSSAAGKQGHGTAAQWQERFKASQPAATDLLIDESGTIGRAYDAKATPQFAIIDAEGTLIYNGAIDDIRSFRKEDIAKANSYVTPILDALLAGQAVTPVSNSAYGCGIKY